jgi:L-histidine N-alpha-methyltransferase
VATVLAPGDAMLLGVDLVKAKARLHAAYNDRAGVTALFNKNILQVLNRRLDADFDVTAFDHVAFYDTRRAWIEMRLRANRATSARVPGARLRLALSSGQEIRTELSCKYTRRSLLRRIAGTRLVLDRWYTDPKRSFALALLRRR